MPPMAFTGMVTKVGFMNKTATVTVSRYMLHKITGKVIVARIVNTMFITDMILFSADRTKQEILGSRRTKSCVFRSLFNFGRLPTVLMIIELRHEDKVVIRNCPPISARKRFKLEKILKSPESEREHSHTQKRAEPSTAFSSLPLESTTSAQTS